MGKLKGIVAFMAIMFMFSGTAVISGCDSPSSGNCCRVCTTGKACGDSCISKDKACNKGEGCACNG